jgi:hypothetical protein
MMSPFKFFVRVLSYGNDRRVLARYQVGTDGRVNIMYTNFFYVYKLFGPEAWTEDSIMKATAKNGGQYQYGYQKKHLV